MIIQFWYEADISWLSSSERARLKKELEACTSKENFEYFDFTSKLLSIGGRYDDQDGYASDADDIEQVLNSYDVDWQGKQEEFETEPDWDSLTGGYDTL